MNVRWVMICSIVGWIACAPASPHDGARLAAAKADETGDCVGCVPSMRFDAACSSGTRLTLAAVGDLLLGPPIQRQAQLHAQRVDLPVSDADPRGAAGYSRLLKHVAPYLRRADITFANMEVPLARDSVSWRCDPVLVNDRVYFDGSVYSGWPQFNAHPSFANAIAESGVDIVQLANNHVLDRRGCGIDRTIASLTAAGVDHVGAVTRSQASQGISPERRYVIRAVKGVRIAFLAYTFGTNCAADDRGPDGIWNTADDRPQVAYIDRQCPLPGDSCTVPRWPASHGSCPARPADAPAHPALFDTIRAARAESDLVVVGMHWGKEDAQQQSTHQTKLARGLLDAGADVILGGHPHVLQPMERHVTTDPETGAPRETFVIHSLGNFLAAQNRMNVHRGTGVILYLGITKPERGRAVVSGVRFVPTTMVLGQEIPTDDAPQDAWNVKPVASNHASYAEATSILGSDRVLRPDAPLVINPDCKRQPERGLSRH